MKKPAFSKLSVAALTTPAFSGCHLTGSALDNLDGLPKTTISKMKTPILFGFTKPDSKNLPPSRLALFAENGLCYRHYARKRVGQSFAGNGIGQTI
ncbi:hypothetical protein [Neisseria yangbaofengii]|nr:hypothetical protein [Neisseria yangbaofengii]